MELIAQITLTQTLRCGTETRSKIGTWTRFSSLTLILVTWSATHQRPPHRPPTLLSLAYANTSFMLWKVELGISTQYSDYNLPILGLIRVVQCATNRSHQCAPGTGLLKPKCPDSTKIYMFTMPKVRRDRLLFVVFFCFFSWLDLAGILRHVRWIHHVLVREFPIWHRNR